MELTGHRCSRCGAELTQQSDTRWRCRYCGCTYDDATAAEHTKKMRELFDEVKLDLVNNLRRNLYDATTAEYISSVDVKQACVELKKYLPDDFSANFYEIAAGNNVKRLTAAIRGIDVEAHRDEVDTILDFLIKSLQPEFLLELNNLAERAYKSRDLKKFERVMTDISVQAEKVQMGVYETKLPREVFVAYSSRDMRYVSELVEVLEEQGLRCFVSARNLRHGKGAVENYDRALKEAMDHCKSFVFVSTPNSRSFSCDALEIEIPHIQKRDIQNAPAEYRNNYAAIPHRFKKPRVEYRVEGSHGFNAADKITDEFFDGYEWVLSPAEVAVRVLRQIVRTGQSEPAPAAAPAAIPQSPDQKYCTNCGTAVERNQRFCSNCGRTKFYEDYQDYLNASHKRVRAAKKRDDEATERRIEAERNKIERKLRAEMEQRDIDALVAATTRKSKISAILLCWLFGALGIDQFYLGYPLRGIFRIACAIGIFVSIVSMPGMSIALALFLGLWCLTDCVRIAIGSLSVYPALQRKKARHMLVGAICFAVIFAVVFAVVVVLGYIDTDGVLWGDRNPLIALGLVQKPPYDSSEDASYDSSRSYDDGPYSFSPKSDGTLLLVSYSGNEEEIIIPASVEGYPVSEIDAWVFDECAEVRRVVIPEGVTHIGDYAFYLCTNLTEVTLPSTLTDIGGSAFQSCPRLSAIAIPDSVTTIGEYAFYDCTDLAQVYLGSGVTAIGASAFSECPSLTEVLLPQGLSRIESSTFWGCASLEHVAIPSSVTSIDQQAFYGCSDSLIITYSGTVAQWRAVGGRPYLFSGQCTVSCDDGVVEEDNRVTIDFNPEGVFSSFAVTNAPEVYAPGQGDFTYNGQYFVISPSQNPTPSGGEEVDFIPEDIFIDRVETAADEATPYEVEVPEEE